jgi:outer membrane protein assembly factor BamD
MRLTETYLALGVRPEAEKAAAVLGANYPGSEWYQRAYKLMREYPAKPLTPLAPGELVVPVATRPSVPGEATAAPPSAEAPAPTTPTTTGGDNPSGSTAPGPVTDTPATTPSAPQ